MLQENGDTDLKQAIFVGNTDHPDFEEAGPPAPVREPKVIFSLKWARLIYAVLSYVLKTRASQ